jgi:hypothetical protein
MTKIAADELRRKQIESDGELGSPAGTPEKSPVKSDVDRKTEPADPAAGRKPDAPDHDDADDDDLFDDGDSDPDELPAKRKAGVH